MINQIVILYCLWQLVTSSLPIYTEQKVCGTDIQHFMITGWKRCRIMILAGSHNSVYMLLTLCVCRIITNSRKAPITIYSWASHVIISYQVSRCRGVKCQSGFTVTQHSPARLSSEVATISCKFMEISNEGCFVNIIPLQTVATTQQL